MMDNILFCKKHPESLLTFGMIWICNLLNRIRILNHIHKEIIDIQQIRQHIQR